MTKVLKKIAIFGESEKGTFGALTHIKNLPELVEKLGQPTPSGLAIHMAIQAMLYNREVLFIKVEEEGYALPHYHSGLSVLKKEPPSLNLAAIALPGVAHPTILEPAREACQLHSSFLIFTEKDLFDFICN